MKIEKDFFTDKITGCEVYEHSAYIDGRVLRARFTVDRSEVQYGCAPPLAFISRSLRHDLMAAIEKELYKGTQ